MICPDCNLFIGENGYTDRCGKLVPCARDTTRFEAEVMDTREHIDLQTLNAMSKNAMPACFEPTRPAFVALARLLMEALQQNQELLSNVPKH